MCKRGGLLVGWDLVGMRALMTTASCKQWSCDECKDMLRNRWVLRAQIGVREFLAADIRVDFVTITSNEKLTNFAQTEYVWRDAWTTLYAALKRKSPKMEYMIIPEKHEDGRMHVHALWTASVTQKWLKDNARKRGLGYMADVRKVADVGNAARYVTKYVGKDLGADVPPKFRRVRVSQGWAEIPKPITEHNLYRWEYVLGERDLDIIMARCQERKIDMVNIQTGEFWDYNDFEINEPT